MRKLYNVALVLCGLLMASTASAQTVQDFFLTAEIPAASSVSFNVSEVDLGPPITFTPVSSTSLTFTMNLNAGLGIYLPETFYAIDVASGGGAGNPNVLLEYVDTNNPNGSVGANGLSAKGVATVVRVSGSEGSQTETEVEKDTLGGISGTTVTSADLAGGFMRLYLGIATGDTSDPTGAEPFTNADQPGLYQGTITLTATLS